MPQTGRERIKATLEGRKPDRLAVEVGSTECTGVIASAYAPLKSGLGVSGGQTRLLDPFSGTVRPERVFREKLGVDAVGLFVEPLRWKAGKLFDGSDCQVPERWQTESESDGAEIFRHSVSECVFRRPSGDWAFARVGAPLAGCRSAEELASHLQAVAFFDWPHHTDEIASQFAVRAAAKRTETEAACVLNVRARLIGGAFELRGERLLADLEESPALVEALLERLADTYVARLTDVLPEVAPHADLVCLTEGPAEGVDAGAYRRHFRRHHERIFAHIKKTSGLPLVVMLRDVDAAIAPEFLELGADGIGIGCARTGPTAAEVRAACGPEVVLWGLGCAAEVLVSGTPGDACVEVAKLVESVGGPERLVFAFGEPLPAGTKHENLLAALETARSMRP